MCLELNHLVPRCCQIALEAWSSQKKAKASSNAVDKKIRQVAKMAQADNQMSKKERDSKSRLDEMSSSLSETSGIQRTYLEASRHLPMRIDTNRYR